MKNVRLNRCFVYVLGSVISSKQEKIRTYVGWSNDLEKRVSQHNKGEGAKSTRGWQWRLLYVEIFLTRSEAMSREWHLKRDRKFRRILVQNWVI